MGFRPAITSLVLATAWCAACADEPVARYHFEVGQELVYEGTSVFEHEHGAHRTEERTTYWVVKQNEDESWHIVAHHESSFFQSLRRGSDHQGPLQEYPATEREEFGVFDLFPDGRVAHVPEGPGGESLTGLLPRMPADITTARSGWEVVHDDGDRWLFSLAPQSHPERGEWILEETEKRLFNAIFLSTSTTVFHFDAQRGFVIKTEGKYTQGYGFNGEGHSGVELKSARRRNAVWVAQLAREAELVGRAQNAVDAATASTQKQARPEDRLAAAEETVSRLAEQVRLPIVQAQLDRVLKRCQDSARYMAQEKKEEEKVIDQPGADWELTDLDGNAHSLRGYRGRVVVLDFWYRGCGWCIKAMPQMKELVEHYRGQPVAILGMNNDREEEDARFVRDQLQLNYPTLKAPDIAQKYAVRGFPTLIIMDQEGIVRGRHVGYSPTLREDLIEAIDRLLTSDDAPPTENASSS